jgi:type IX secretion system PorP/SprF family membrane protein
MKKLIPYILITFLALPHGQAQENHFSQFYTSPQYINPAFAGDVAYMKTGGATRLMQPLPNRYIVNSLLHFDYKIPHHQGGVGFTFFHHTEELSHSKFQLNYSYTIRLSKNSWLKLGLGASINMRRTNTADLTFPDQYNNYGLTGNPTAETALKDNTIFPAVATGAVLYNEILWMSISVDYLNLPKENFAGKDYTYPMKFSFLSGMLYPINKTTSKRRFSKFGGLEPYSGIGPLIAVTIQDKYLEASGGLAVHIKPIFGGVHYRYQHELKNSSVEYAYKGLVLMAGYRQEEFSCTYSYDYAFTKILGKPLWSPRNFGYSLFK